MLFFNKKFSDKWLIVGLGNPGMQYENSRHNIGFDALDFAAKKWKIDIRKSKFDGLVGTGKIEEHKVVLLKPHTFINLSGKSVRAAADFHKIALERVLILTDDVSLDAGVLRIRLDGSAGGHNGLKSIIAAMGDGFPRIKIGVGKAPNPQYDLADWVLSRFTPAERKAIETRFADIVSASELLLNEDTAEAMSRYNGR